MKIPREAILTNNPYGYQLDISHDAINPLYLRFKEWKKIPPWCPLSDAQRREFENYLLKVKA